MLNTDKSDVREVAGCYKDSLKIPDSFVGIRETIRQEAATIGLGKNPRIPPFCVRPGEWPHIENINNEDISWFRTIDGNRPTEYVRNRQINITNIVSTIIVLNLTISQIGRAHV